MNDLQKEFNLSKDAENKFHKYYEYLISENEKINLTSITKEDEVYIKHFYDSLLNSKIEEFDKFKNICDIGSGAGFPSIPLKIAFPYINVTIIEPIKKRTEFLNRLTKLLFLENIDIQNKRAEDNVEREKYDACFIRAVAKISILLEIALPYVKENGYLVLMKGPSYKEELKEANNAFKILNAEVIKEEKFTLPQNIGERYLIVIKKTKITSSKYPRKFALIKKSPL